MIVASAGKFSPSWIVLDARGSPVDVGSCKFFAEDMPVAITEPSSLTGNTCSNWPWESTTYLSLLTLKAPFRVYTVCVDVRLGFIAKKPCPDMARSSALRLASMFP